MPPEDSKSKAKNMNLSHQIPLAAIQNSFRGNKILISFRNVFVRVGFLG